MFRSWNTKRTNPWRAKPCGASVEKPGKDGTSFTVPLHTGRVRWKSERRAYGSQYLQSIAEMRWNRSRTSSTRSSHAHRYGRENTTRMVPSGRKMSNRGFHVLERGRSIRMKATRNERKISDVPGTCFSRVQGLFMSRTFLLRRMVSLVHGVSRFSSVIEYQLHLRWNRRIPCVFGATDVIRHDVWIRMSDRFKLFFTPSYQLVDQLWIGLIPWSDCERRRRASAIPFARRTIDPFRISRSSERPPKAEPFTKHRRPPHPPRVVVLRTSLSRDPPASRASVEKERRYERRACDPA